MTLRKPSEAETEQARAAAKALREVMGTAWEVYIASQGGVRLAGVGERGEVVLAAPEHTAGVVHTYAGKWMGKASQQAGVQIRWASPTERRTAWEQ